jgi:hypothetical protein
LTTLLKASLTARQEQRERSTNDALLRLKQSWLFPDLPSAERDALIETAYLMLVGPKQRDRVFTERFIDSMPASQVPRFLKTLRHVLLDRVISGRLTSVAPLAVKYLAMEICREPSRAETRLALLVPGVAARVRRQMAEFAAEHDA